MKVVISSGHGLYVRGASGIIDEVNEARLVVEELAACLRRRDVEVETFHDDISTTQNENLSRIVQFHNERDRDFDISVHFNAYEQVEGPMGTEVLYTTQSEAARRISAAIASVGLIDRGPKKRTDLYFLNETDMPAVLIEVCFVDSATDVEIYEENFDLICERVAKLVGDQDEDILTPPDTAAGFYAVGRCSFFGGPDDHGVSADEGLAFYDDISQAPQLFLPMQPEGTTGLARRLNPCVHYLACRWDYDVTPREMLRTEMACVRSTKTGISLLAFPADWGPHEDTRRVADLSPSLLMDLGIETDDEVEVTFPHREE